MIPRLAASLCVLGLLPAICFSQSLGEMQGLLVPGALALSSDGSRLTYRLGADWWEIGTTSNSNPQRSAAPPRVEAVTPPKVAGTSRLSSPLRSPDGARVAYLDAAYPEGPLALFCLCGGSDGAKPQLVSKMPIRGFQWAKDSKSFWVITGNGVDTPVGLLTLDGRFKQMTQGAAMRGMSGLVASNDVVAWVQSDGSHHGTIWIKSQRNKSHMLWDPNPQTAKWSQAWTQEVLHWKNSHGEELEGILASPKGGKRLPLVVDPYSSWVNRFLNVGILGNYQFVKAGYAVFFPNHRAPHSLPGRFGGEAYVGSSKDRDPVAVVTDDVMSGVEELARRGIVDRNRLFLYSFSNGASAIDQLLTRTTAFRAAVAQGGVADWLGYYNANRVRGDETISDFLGGRKPEDSSDLYNQISPIYHVDRITTPLLIAVGENDSLPGGGSRAKDAQSFYEALRKAGRSVELVVYPGEGHGLSSLSLAEQHLHRTLDFFKAH